MKKSDIPILSSNEMEKVIEIVDKERGIRPQRARPPTPPDHPFIRILRRRLVDERPPEVRQFVEDGFDQMMELLLEGRQLLPWPDDMVEQVGDQDEPHDEVRRAGEAIEDETGDDTNNDDEYEDDDDEMEDETGTDEVGEAERSAHTSMDESSEDEDTFEHYGDAPETSEYHDTVNEVYNNYTQSSDSGAEDSFVSAEGTPSASAPVPIPRMPSAPAYIPPPSYQSISATETNLIATDNDESSVALSVSPISPGMCEQIRVLRANPQEDPFLCVITTQTDVFLFDPFSTNVESPLGAELLARYETIKDHAREMDRIARRYNQNAQNEGAENNVLSNDALSSESTSDIESQNGSILYDSTPHPALAGNSSTNETLGEQELVRRLRRCQASDNSRLCFLSSLKSIGIGGLFFTADQKGQAVIVRAICGTNDAKKLVWVLKPEIWLPNILPPTVPLLGVSLLDYPNTDTRLNFTRIHLLYANGGFSSFDVSSADDFIMPI